MTSGPWPAPEGAFKPGGGILVIAFVIIALAVCVVVGVSHGRLDRPADGPSPSPATPTAHIPASGSARGGTR